MPYYQRFKRSHTTYKKTVGTSRQHYTRSTLYHNTQRLKTASKHSAVNPIVVKLSIVVLVFAILFGFIKSGASNNIGRIIKIGNKEKNTIASIGTSDNISAGLSDEEQMNILRNQTFKIFAKPEGDDSVIYEVVDDDAGGEDYFSTVVRKASLESLTNSSNNNINSSSISNQDEYSTSDSIVPSIDGNALRNLFNHTIRNRTNNQNTDNQSSNNSSADNQNKSIPDNEANVTISESAIASVLNQDYSENVLENSMTKVVESKVDKVVESKKFEEILSPRTEDQQMSSQKFIPTKTPSSGITDENSKKEYEQPQSEVTKTYNTNAIINNNLNYSIESNKRLDNNINVTIPSNTITINNNVKNNPSLENTKTENQSIERSEVLDIVESAENNEQFDNINKPSSDLQPANKNTPQTNNNTENTTDNSWNINIDRNTNTPQTTQRALRNVNLKPSIFLAQYDEKLGNITIIPKERNMSKNTTLEEAILSLLEGVKEEEYNDNIISLISRNTSLLDLFVDNETVYLNFSDDFEFNPLGDEGIIVQIYQIVYTATQFEGINKVVFLINGEQKEFLGSEGQILNKEFTRMEIEDIEDTLQN